MVRLRNPSKTTLLEIAESISPRLAKEAAGEVDKHVVDLKYPIEKDALFIF